MHDEAELHALAARQYGLAHQKQLTRIGLRRSARDHLVESGRWYRLTEHVLQIAGSPSSELQAAMLAVLDLDPYGAALSVHTAATRWGLPGFALRPFHVMGNRERGRNSEHFGVVHQPRLLLPSHVRLLDGIPTTEPTRTLFDLAGVLKWPKQTERAVDNALAMGLTSVRRLSDMLEQLACKGRPGIRLMRSLIDARRGNYVPPASGLEARFQELARRAGVWTLERQVDVGDDAWIGRVDFVDRAHNIIVEVQSTRYHSALTDVARDAERIAALRAAGWKVVEIPEYDVWHNPERVVTVLFNAYR
jgi:very-short-patch-repair endonuclease